LLTTLRFVLWHFLCHIELISVETSGFALATLTTNEALSDLATACCATAIIGIVDLVGDTWQL